MSDAAAAKPAVKPTVVGGTNAGTAATTAPAAAKGGPAVGKIKTPTEKKPKERTFGGFRPDQKITLQKDNEGKEYGPANNPKRELSKAHKLFVKYRTGMTVLEFIQSGGTPSTLKYDTSHGYVKIA